MDDFTFTALHTESTLGILQIPITSPPNIYHLLT